MTPNRALVLVPELKSAEILTGVFARLNFEVTVCEDAIDLLIRLQSAPPNAIVADPLMSDGAALSVLIENRALLIRHSVQTCFLTERSPEIPEYVRAFSWEYICFLIAPF